MFQKEYYDFISIEGLRKQVSISPLTRKEICERAGINEETLNPLLLRTRKQLTRTDVIAKLAYALECKIDDLVEFKGIKYSNECFQYSRLPLEPEPELSYAPLTDMYFDMYGPQYKEKLSAAFKKVHSVDIKVTQGVEPENEGISYVKRIRQNKPLTLAALYEVCKALKCTPGCVFGCKGKYNWEKKNSPLNDFNFQNQKIKVVIFNNEELPLEVNSRNWSLGLSSPSCPEDDIGSYVLYDSNAIDFGKGRMDLIPDKTVLYPLEKIDMNSDKPYFCNGEWHKTICIVVLREVVNPLMLYFTGYFSFKNLRFRINGYKRLSFKRRELNIFSVFKSYGGEQICVKTKFSDFAQAFKYGKDVFIYSKYFNNKEKVLKPAFIPKEDYC